MQTPYYTLTADETIKALKTDPVQGLAKDEAASRLKQYGLNELTPPKVTPLWKTFLMQFNDFLIWILLGAVAISFYEGQVVEAIAIIGVLLINAILGTFQEYRAGQALEALKEMSAPNAMVIRGSELLSVPAKELVPGDIVSLESGNRIPADGRLIETNALRNEEAALTGESLPSRKEAGTVSEVDSPLGDRQNMVFAGTDVAVGRGLFVVTETGTGTEMGNIARLIASAEEEQTPLQIELARVGTRIALLILVATTIVLGVDLFQGNPFSESLLVAISLAVAAIPEGLPAVVTIALSLGVKRMAERNAIVKKLHAVETLGSTTFICSDKTGTLTQNIMTVRELLIGLTPASVGIDGRPASTEGSINIADEDRLFDIALSANDARYDADNVLIGDPTETALVAVAHLRYDGQIARPRIGEIPFNSDRKRMTTIHADLDGSREVYTKGGVDVVLALCDRACINGEIVPMTDSITAQIMEAYEQFASHGYRALAFAYRPLGADEALEGDHIEQTLIYVGVMAMLDPPRPEVIESIAECHRAGIEVAMITGDHALTAKAIAAEVGLPVDTPVVTGPELERMSDEELFEIVSHTYIYARVNPEHKIRIVNALKRHGNIVAMTGDGVNDAPALKSADIGVAMGVVGTDVSREAADMVLADDNFSTIVAAVEEGRIVFDNLRKSILFLLSNNTGAVLTVFFATLFPLAKLVTPEAAQFLSGPALTALQLLWINLVTDSLPALALGIDPGSTDVMDRKPRDAKESILSPQALRSVALQGSFIALGALMIYYGSAFGWFGNIAPSKLQTMLLTSVVFARLIHSFNFRSDKKSVFSVETLKNRWLLFAVLGSILLQVILVYTPPLQAIFRTVSLSPIDWAVVALGAALPLVLNDIIKMMRRKR
jgi:Ca2+-transporting ATPase